MRSIGGFTGADWPVWPDYINTVLPTSIGSIATFDYPALTTSVTQVSSSPAYVQVISQNANVWFCPNSTNANVPAAANLTGGSSQVLVSNAVPLRSALPPGSTGGSVAFPTTAGGATIMFWKK